MNGAAISIQLKRTSVLFLLVASLLVSPLVEAGSFKCRGVPSRLTVSREGYVRFTVGFGVWTVCNVNADGYFGGIPITEGACRSWQAQVMAAQIAGRTVDVVFYSETHNSVTNPPECSAFGHGVSMPVSSIELVD